jgi:hypothetical protein
VGREAPGCVSVCCVNNSCTPPCAPVRAGTG